MIAATVKQGLTLEWGTVPAWASIAVAVASLLFAAYSWARNREIKKLTYELLSDQPLFTRGVGDDWQELKLMHGQEEIRQPRVATVRVRNAGTEALTADDFTRPITIRLGGAATGQGRIVSVNVSEVSAQGDRRALPPLDVTNDGVEFPTSLLNRGEALDFQLLIDGDRELEVDAKAAGFDWSRRKPNEPLLDLDVALAVSAAPTSLAGGIGYAFISVVAVLAKALSVRRRP